LRYGLRPWLHRPPDDKVALKIEAAIPELRSRFIASIQLTRREEEHSRPLVRALVKETVEVTRDLPFDRVVETGARNRWLQIAAGAVALGGSLWWWGGSASWPLLQRAFLLNVAKPSNTKILSFPGDRVAAVGDDLRMDVLTGGIIPTGGKLFVQPAGKPVQEFTLDPDPANPARFVRTLLSLQESFRYWVHLGDAKSPRATVTVRPRPTVLEVTFNQQWPAYTGLPPQRRTPADLKILAGSKLEATIKANVPLGAAEIQLLDPARKTTGRFPMTLQGTPPIQGIGAATIPLKDATGLTFALKDEAGVESRGLTNYRLEIVPDQAPTLAILWPQRREELVTARATLLIAFEARDDFGLGGIKLHYAVNWSEGAPHRTLELDLGAGSPKALTRRFEWNLGRMTPALKEGDIVDFWFEATDSNDATGPGVMVLPEHYQARVVSEEEKRADLAARLADTLQGLNDVRQGQETLAHELGELIHEK
jgi:hypothetical protein